MNRKFDTGHGQHMMITDVDELTFKAGSLEGMFEVVREKTQRMVDVAPDDDEFAETVKSASLKALSDEVETMALEDVLELDAVISVDSEITEFERTLTVAVEAGLNRITSWKGSGTSAEMVSTTSNSASA